MFKFTCIRASSEVWTLKEYGKGSAYLLVHEPSGKSAWFQGDDADLWDANIRALDAIKVWNAGNSFTQSFDFLCSGYVDVLTGGNDEK